METISTENAEHYTWGEICDGWHLLKCENLSVIKVRVPPGGREVRHYHEHSHQFFFVLSGEATLEIEQKKVVIGLQQGVSVPPNVPHRLVNESQEDVFFLVISSPSSHADRVIVD